MAFTWYYFIPHDFPPDTRTTWADVLLLPGDDVYEGPAMWVTVDAILSDDFQNDEPGPARLAQLGDRDFFMDTDTMDLAVRAHDFDLPECLDWVARWLRDSGFDCSELVRGSAEDFAGRHQLADITLDLRDKYGNP